MCAWQYVPIYVEQIHWRAGLAAWVTNEKRGRTEHPPNRLYKYVHFTLWSTTVTIWKQENPPKPTVMCGANTAKRSGNRVVRADIGKQSDFLRVPARVCNLKVNVISIKCIGILSSARSLDVESKRNRNKNLHVALVIGWHCCFSYYFGVVDVVVVNVVVVDVPWPLLNKCPLVVVDVCCSHYCNSRANAFIKLSLKRL